MQTTRRGPKKPTELRRWPRHLDQSIEAKTATLSVAGTREKRSLGADATRAKFAVELPAGKTSLRTILERPDGHIRGAYFVYVTRQ